MRMTRRPGCQGDESDHQWRRSETYWLLDRTIRVRSQSDPFSDALAVVLGHATPPHRAARAGDSYFICARDGTYTVCRERTRVVETDSMARAMELLLADMNRHILFSYRGFAAHAGVVRHPSGRTLIFPGTSGAGKSTLTAASVLSGFEYLSDEALCVPYGEVTALPYLKPINLSDWSRHHLDIDGEVVGEKPISPIALGDVHRTPATVTDIVHLHREEDLNLNALGSNRSVGTLIEMSFNHFRKPEQAFRTATRLAAGARSWKLSYDSAISAAHLLFERFSRPE